MAGFALYQEERDKDLLSSLIGWMIDILAAAALAVFIILSFCCTVSVKGISMYPTLCEGEKAFYEKISQNFTDYNRYDIVVVDQGVHRNIKRILGLPGEELQILHGHVYINGEELPEFDSIGEIRLAGIAGDPIVLGEDEYFLIGDNADSSEDSRSEHVGAISKDRIYGRVWLLISPWDKIGPVA